MRSDIINNARQLRRHSTDTEQRLWRALRDVSKRMGMKFRRQHPLDPYIVDFVCLDAQLVVEVDGYSHDVKWRYDKKREEYLRKSGYRIMRFRNEDVLVNLDGVVTTIQQALAVTPHLVFLGSPAARQEKPSSPARGEEIG